MRIPNKIKIGGHIFDIIQTDDTNLLDGDSYGLWSRRKQKIYLKKTMPDSLKEETLLHEAGEVILRVYLEISAKEFCHENWTALSTWLYALLVDNNMRFGDEKHSPKG